MVYYGDEIGMTNGKLTADDIQDNFSPANSVVDSRDLERTPMQWNDSQFAGFSSVNLGFLLMIITRRLTLIAKKSQTIPCLICTESC